MAIDKVAAHRPGPFKQSNKSHKHGRHRSKGAIDIASKGRVSVKTFSKKQKRELNRNQRRNQALQIRQKKRDDVLSKKRSLGGIAFAPFLICVLPLKKSVDPKTTLSILTQCDEEATVSVSSSGVTHISIPRFKQRFSFVMPSVDNELEVLDALKICDTVLFLISASNGQEQESDIIDEWGQRILFASFAQGLPTPVVAITDLESMAPKKRNDNKQNIQKCISKWLPEEKVMPLDTNVEAINVLRTIGNQKRRSVLHRDRRPHLYGEHVEYVPDSEGTQGTLKITGYLRGTSLSVNNLVHIPGLGDCQLSQIVAPFDPHSIDTKRDLAVETDAKTVRVLQYADPNKQESLDSENIPDPMDAEQTWPTSEEIKMAEKEMKDKKIVKRVPKGWSDYQAAWIPDNDAEFISDHSDEEDVHSDYMNAISEERSDISDDDQVFDSVTESEIGISDQQYDQQMDFHAEKLDLEKAKAAKTDLIFPDEMDTPQEAPARERFQKYRGLESFRTSPWDPKEHLPSDYARIFQFENFDRTKKRILKEHEEIDGVMPGWYITIYVKNVSTLLWSNFKIAGTAVVVIGLFPHEHKMSVLNVVLKRTSDYEEPIESKEQLIFQCGCRRFAVNPIFSQHTNGKKHKYERFFQPSSTVVATFYAPIQFPPAPVLCYKEIKNKLQLIATGTLLSCNPDRLIIKRVVLSGHPFKIHKRSAVIRFMFFNRDDIVYFKPCKLRTKHGRIGHIREPLGTHGHMKCIFDGQIKSQDTVLLNLYKRVFPKWNFEECTTTCEDALMEKMES